MRASAILHHRLERRFDARGRGGVYLAEATQLVRPVALKVMSAEQAEDPHQHERLGAASEAGRQNPSRARGRSIAALPRPGLCP